MSDDVSSDTSQNDSSTELILYDQKITSIQQVKVKHHGATRVMNLNLHCNKIHRIADLADFIYLRILDLSSNEIKKIEGLTVLKQLQVLNLASNKITVIEGLSGLTELKKLNLAYNQIESIAGLATLHGSRYAIESLDLRGNLVESLKELTFLSGCVHLKEVCFQYQKRSANPVCNNPRYTRYIVNKNENLELLDGVSLKSNLQNSIRRYPELMKYAALLNDDFDDIVQLPSPEINNQISVEPEPVHIIVHNQDTQTSLEKLQSKAEVEIQTNKSTPRDIPQLIEAERTPSPTIHYESRSIQTDDEVEKVLVSRQLQTDEIQPPTTFSISIQTDDTFHKHDKFTQCSFPVADPSKRIETLLENSKKENTVFRSHIEKLCEELGATKVYIQNRETELADHFTKNRRLQKKLEDQRLLETELRKQIDTAKSLIQKYQKQYQVTTQKAAEDIKAADEKIRSLTVSVQNLSTERQELKQQRDFAKQQYQAVVQAAAEECKAAEEKIQSMSLSLQSLTAENNGLKQQLDCIKQSYDQQQQKIVQKAADDSRISEEKIQSLSQSVQTLTAENQELKKQRDKQVEHEVAMYKSLVEKRNNSLKSLEKLVYDMQEQLERERKEAQEQLEKERKEAQDKKVESIKIKDQIIESNNSEIQKYRERLDEMKEKERRIVEESRNAKSDLLDAEREIEELNLAVSELKSKHRDGKEKRERLREALQESEQKLATLQQQCSEQEANSKLLEEKRRKQIIILKEENEDMKNAILQMKQSRQISDEDISKVLRVLESTKDKLKQKMSECSELTTQLEHQKRTAEEQRRLAEDKDEKLVRMRRLFEESFK